MTAVVFADALGEVARYFEELPDIATKAATLAINQVAGRDGLAVLRRDMRSQIDFPSGYLESDRLKLASKASRFKLEATIRGRDRATSLARFAKGQNPGNTRGRGVRVTVKPGQTRHLKNAFLVRLKNGNMGLAVRLKPGEQIRNSEKAVRLADNVFLLYGPSVDQVFRGVADDRAPEIGEMVSRQFLRQMTRLTRG